MFWPWEDLALSYGSSELALGWPTDAAAVIPEHGMPVALVVITIAVLAVAVAVTGIVLALGWEGGSLAGAIR
jgi:hypothetical protein